MKTHTDQLNEHITNVMAQITEAASKHDLNAIQRLSRKASEFQELKEQVASIEHRITKLANDDAMDSPLVVKNRSSGNLRELPMEVTEGDIRQNLLKLTPHVKRGKIKVGEEMVIESQPSGEQFQTVVSDKGNKLRARGEIARFYKEARVKAGDYVLLTEHAPKRWSLKKAPDGEYGISRTFREFTQ